MSVYCDLCSQFKTWHGDNNLSAGPNDQHRNIAFICHGGDPEAGAVNYSSDTGTPGQSMLWRRLSRSLGDGRRDGQRYV